MRWDAHHYQPILDAIAGRRVALIQNDVSGNYGDEMIHLGTVALFEHWRIEFTVIAESLVEKANFVPHDVVALFGSGSVGRLCSDVVERRQKIAAMGKPCFLLPSTAMDTFEDLSYCEAVFMREQVSAAMYRCVHPNVHCCPDMAMFLNIESEKGPQGGVFLREDDARVDFEYLESQGDPVQLCASYNDYLYLAGSHYQIITNRLHFAVAGILQDCDVTLAPTNWHKLRAFYDTWFADLPNVHWLDK